MAPEEVENQAEETEETEDLVEEVDETEALRKENEELIDTLQRLQAEFDNYRKRALRDQESLVARAHERLVKELLPVLDDLERALVAAEQHEEAKAEEGSVIEVLQKGYRLGDRVLRPSRVVVAGPKDGDTT